MNMVIDTIILFISIVNFILTLFVFLNTKELKQHISFLIFSFITTLWLFDNFLLRIYPYSIHGPLSYGLGILVATCAVFWVYNLIGEKIPKFIAFFIVPFSALVFFLTFLSSYVVSSFGEPGALGSTGVRKGSFFLEYSLYLAFLITTCLYKLAKASIQEKNILKKKQTILVLFGSMVFGLTAIIVELFLPIFFNNFKVVYLDNLTYLFFFIFILYSIVKYNLFGIKVIMTQLLIVIFLSLLLLHFLFSNTFDEYIWNGISLLIFAFISYIIIKSLFSEIKIHKKLLEETQKNLNLQKKLGKEFAEMSEKTVNEIEKQL